MSDLAGDPLISRIPSNDFLERLLGHHPRVQAVEALPCILEIKALLQDIFVAEPVQGIPHGPRRKVCLLDNIFLGQQATGFQDLEYELGRWR